MSEKHKRHLPGRITGSALAQLFRKPATIAYPKGPLQLTPGYRGKLKYDATNCIGCNLCVKDCPAQAIQVTNVGAPAAKRFEMTLNLGHCIFCGQCVDSCKKGCLELTSEIELASLDKQELVRQKL